MILWDKMKKSFDSGVDALKRIAISVSERARIESAVARHLIDKGTLESRLDRQHRELGERVFQLWEQGAEDPMRDQYVMEALKDIAMTTEQVEELKLKVKKASLGEKEG